MSEPDTTGSPAVLDLKLSGLARGGIPVLGPIALRVARGQAVALVGPSGVGKTSLLRCVLGLETGFPGTVLKPECVTAVFQEPSLLPWRTVLENVQLPSGADRAAAIALLERVGLADQRQNVPGQLSLGQQRRVALARALAARPDLICLDEPFVSLDPTLARDMRALVAELQSSMKLTILMVTHDLDDANAIADRIVTLDGQPARIVADQRAARPTDRPPPRAGS